jgi:hypothetical protein
MPMSQSAFAEPRLTPPTPESVVPCSHAGCVVSEDAYWRLYYLESDIHYEWNDGRLEEKPVSD